MSPVAILLTILIWRYVPRDEQPDLQKLQGKNQVNGRDQPEELQNRLSMTQRRKDEKRKSNYSYNIDIKGAITLSISIIFFLVFVSNFEPAVSSSSSPSSSKTISASLSQYQTITSRYQIVYLLIGSASMALYNQVFIIKLCEY